MIGHDDDRLAPELQDLAVSVGMGEKLFFAGFRHPIEDWIAGMDLLMATSEREPFGRTLIECMALGVPVVAAGVGGHADIVEHERNGLLVPANDAMAFADAAHRILSDSEFSKDLIDAARNLVDKRYSLRNHASRIMSIYEDLS